MKISRTVLGATLALALSFAGLPAADARPGGGSSPSVARSSVSRAAPAPAAVKPAAAPSPSRVGGGGSSGMSRSSVMAQARDQSPNNPQKNNAPVGGAYGGGGGGSGAAYAAGAGYGSSRGYNGYGAAGQPVQPVQPVQPAQRSGYSGAQLAGAAAAGAVGGYLLNEATRPHMAPGVSPGAVGYTAPQSTPNYVSPSGAVDGVMPQQAVVAPPPVGVSGPSMGGVFGFLFLMALVVGIGYALSPLSRGSKSAGASAARSTGSSAYNSNRAVASFGGVGDFGSGADVENQLLSGASQVFRSLQDAYGRRDREGVARLVDDSYLDSLLADMDAEAQEGRAAVKVHSVKVIGNRVLGFEKQDERYVGSVHFLADISEGLAPSYEIEEVWHFVRPLDVGDWKLAGIEQVNG